MTRKQAEACHGKDIWYGVLQQVYPAATLMLSCGYAKQ